MDHRDERADMTLPPYKLNQLHKTAGKILDMLLVPAQFVGNYDDAKFVIRLVATAIGEAEVRNKNE